MSHHSHSVIWFHEVFSLVWTFLNFLAHCEYTNTQWSSKNQVFVVYIDHRLMTMWWISLELGTPRTPRKADSNAYKYLQSPLMWNSNLFSVDSRCCWRRREQPNNTPTQSFIIFVEIFLDPENEIPRFCFGYLLCCARSTTR